MALAKQTLALILISTCIIFSSFTDANHHHLKQSKPSNKDSKPCKPDKQVKPDKPLKPDKQVKPGKPLKPDKPSKPDKPTKPDKPSQLPTPSANEVLPKGKAEVANMVAKQMQCVQKKIDEFNAALKKRLGHHKSSHRTRECVSECDEVFGAAIADIKKTLDSLKSLNLMKANFDVSAVATNVDTCNDCFDEIGCGGDAEVKKLGDWVRKITGDALAALQKAN